ncbi:hypothetical protein SUGI_0091270 [Cryptomeria japonica]|uniref:cytochrome b561 domain-containing protein At2g30890 n=1 Tax=Cryptomeria japonica TaxID=3369 RepID=UPI002408D490|nr:cytochrome b561 domain-containing protein At2g30890 [Cryptomeria japonica]GLJ08558.1 hypothetical protein SUGI_0091270 [Cryptomeria japonica]
MGALQCFFTFIGASLVLSVTALDKSVQYTDYDRHFVVKKSLTYEKAHGFLLWASMGFLMPIAIIVIRMSRAAKQQGSARKLEVLFYIHVGLQSLAFILATAGAIISLVKFNNKFYFTHRRLGLGLYIIVWLQPIVGFLRPQRGMQGRCLWYFVHWILGTGGVILGIVNTYIGFRAYELMSLTSLRTLNILFSIEVSVIGAFYLIQDRWDYLIQQGALKAMPVTPAVVYSQQEQQTPISSSESNVTSVDCGSILKGVDILK